MNPILKEIKDIREDYCVTIVLNTHRTMPDNEKDPILLKNLQAEAVRRLHENPGKRPATPIVERLESLVDSIDHRHNTESLVLFVSNTISKYTRLSIAVQDRVVIDNNFATRDLIRAEHTLVAYYTLLLGRDRARLLEAANGRLVAELGRPFPMVNNTLVPHNRTVASNATRMDNFDREYYVRLDKALWAVWQEHPLPILTAADDKTLAHFMEVTSLKEQIIGNHKESYDLEAHHVIANNWPTMEEYARQANESRLAELKEQLNKGAVLTDLNDIWKTIEEGRGKTLFVQKGFYQPARIVDVNIELADESQIAEPEVIDDIIDEMVELNARYGGDNVFVFEGGLETFNGIGLTTRY